MNKQLDTLKTVVVMLKNIRHESYRRVLSVDLKKRLTGQH